MKNPNGRTMILVSRGILCAAFLSGCTGGMSPIGPTSAARSERQSAAPQPDTLGGVPDRLASVKQDDFRFIECHLPDGSFTQISVNAWGMPGAVHQCIKVLDGRSDGVVKAPPPSLAE